MSVLIGLDTSPTAGLLAMGPVAALCVAVSSIPALMPLAVALAACARQSVSSKQQYGRMQGR